MEKLINVVANSEAEKFFIEKVMPMCKDSVACRLGIFFGHPEYNQYVISAADKFRLGELFKK